MLRGTTLNSHGIAVPHCAQNNGVRSVTGLFLKNSPMPLQDHVPQVVCRPLSPDRALFWHPLCVLFFSSRLFIYKL